MNDEAPDPKQTGYYFALAQVGLEMAVPIGAGAALDLYVGWGPWTAIVGVFAGFGLGFWHIITLSRRFSEKDDRQADDGEPKRKG